jgi:hypothetical protein
MIKKPASQKMTAQSPMYIYATEMVSSYYKNLGVKGKKILSIVGSGDQIIDAYYFGAKEVVGFDINQRAFFMLDLKFQAIKILSYREFLKFFGSNLDNGTLDFTIYKKIRNKLSLKTSRFFDKIYQEFNNDGKKLFNSEYFRQRSMIKSSTVDINHYLKNEKEYVKCGMILQNKTIKFLELDVNDIIKTKELKDKFDIINLSNVLNYLTNNVEEGSVLRLAEATKKISQKIRKNGIFFYYSYSPYIYRSKGKIPPAARKNTINAIKKINNFKVAFKIFKGVKPNFSKNTFDKINIFSV